MQLPLWLKILLLLGCIYLIADIIYIDLPIDNAIKKEYDALYKLRGDPHLDTAANRKIYAQKKAAIQYRIDRLSEKKHADWWYRAAPIVLTLIGGWLLRSIIAALKTRRTKIPAR